MQVILGLLASAGRFTKTYAGVPSPTKVFLSFFISISSSILIFFPFSFHLVFFVSLHSQWSISHQIIHFNHLYPLVSCNKFLPCPPLHYSSICNSHLRVIYWGGGGYLNFSYHVASKARTFWLYNNEIFSIFSYPNVCSTWRLCLIPISGFTGILEYV